MSYTYSADAYIGDVSSQVYEFLVRPRACFFIDTHSKGHSPADPAYEFWLNGPVASSTAQLFPEIENHRAVAKAYEAEQERLMQYTMSYDPERSASERGAAALAAEFPK